MISSASAVQSDAFLEADAGFEYFTTPTHYQAVAARVLAALAGGGRFILLTGNPPPNGRVLSNALSKAAMGKHTVIGVPCGHNLSGDDWRRLVPGNNHDANIQEFSAGALLVALGTPLPLYVLEDADQLSDEQLQEFFSTWLFGEPTIGTAVLTVTSAFLARLERPTLSFLIEGLAARMLFNHLGPDEVATFLRQQLSESEVERVFTADTIAAISAASGGDPALVNRLAGRALEAYHGASARPLPQAAVQPVEPEPETLEAPEREAFETPNETPPEAAAPDALPALPAALTEPIETDMPATAPTKRRLIGRRLVIGTGFALAYFAILFLLGTFIPRYFRPADDARTTSPSRSTEKVAEAKPSAPAIPEQPAPPVGQLSSIPSGGERPDAKAAAEPAIGAAAGATPKTQPEPAETVTVIPVAQPPRSEPALASTTPDLKDVKATPQATPPTASAPPAIAPTPAPSPPSARTPPAPPAATKPPPATAALTPQPSTSPAPASAPVPAAAPSSNAASEIAALIARGDEYLTTGDIISARLYYERAANAGDGHAAMLMGETFDPDFLSRAGVRGVRGDPEIAAMWYHRAQELGDRDAGRHFAPFKTN